MKTNNGISPNRGKIAFSNRKKAEHFPAGVPRLRTFVEQTAGASSGEENLNSNSARNAPSIYMKTNHGSSPNPGKLRAKKSLGLCRLRFYRERCANPEALLPVYPSLGTNPV
jgi:hypothetical protein